jgi:hypothetical protein
MKTRPPRLAELSAADTLVIVSSLILNISSENGATMHGMSFEIGAGGMSAATSGQLEVGEQVLLYPVVRARLKATVRRKNGSMYGFEFLAPTAEFQEMVLALCQTLPLFQTMADI